MSTPTPIDHVVKSLLRRFGQTFAAQIAGIDRATLTNGRPYKPCTQIKLRAAKARLYGFHPKEIILQLKADHGSLATANILGLRSETVQLVPTREHLRAGTLTLILNYWEQQKAATLELARITKLKKAKEKRDNETNTM